MSPFLRRVGFALSFVILATALHAQIFACPTVQVALQIAASQISVEKPARARLSRAVQSRPMSRPVAAAFV